MLDSLGRWYLRTDYRIIGLIILAIVLIFTFWRHWRYKSSPSKDDYLTLVLSLLSIAGGLPVCAAFLLTKPPAIDMLPGSAFALIGLLVPIILFGYGLPKLKVLFFPQQAPLQAPSWLRSIRKVRS